MLNSEFIFPITFYRLLRRRSTTFWTKLPTDHQKLPRQSPQRPKPLSPQVWPQDNLIPLISLQKMMFRFIGNCPLATFKFLSSNQGTVRLHFFSHIARPQGLWKSKCIFVSGPTCLWSTAAATETVTLTPSASAKAVAAAATKTKKIKVRQKNESELVSSGYESSRKNVFIYQPFSFLNTFMLFTAFTLEKPVVRMFSILKLSKKWIRLV